MNEKAVNIAIIGGSGFWAEEAHYAYFQSLREKYTIHLSAIVDPIDPYTVTSHSNLQKALREHDPKWLRPSDFSHTDDIVRCLKDDLGVNLVFIVSTPCTHYEYGMSCITHNINVICSKPVISHRNASTDPVAAELIIKQYDLLHDAYTKTRQIHANLLFHTILRLRSLDVFIRVSRELEKVYHTTGAGINCMSVIFNGGKYKFPAELNAPGAHGYLEGIGSISHSAYHYLDVMMWYLSCAPGGAVKMRPRLNYVFRIEDYLRAASYNFLAKTIDEKPQALEEPQLSKETLGCELNAGFTFDLYDANDVIIGSNSFLFNLTSFTPRTLTYDKHVHEPADKSGGGRMSHLVMDIHQDGLQNWQIRKDDIVFESDNIYATGRRHPFIEGVPQEEIVAENAYDTGVTLKDLLDDVMSSVSNDLSLINHPYVRSLDEERLATELYGTCYRLIADNYANKVNVYDIYLKSGME